MIDYVGKGKYATPAVTSTMFNNAFVWKIAQSINKNEPEDAIFVWLLGGMK